MATVGEGATPLMYVCQQAKEKECLEILTKKPLSAFDKDRTQKTPLHYCAESLSTGCAEALIRVAPDIVNVRDEDGYAALHLAVIAGNKPFIQLLLSKGADVNALDLEKHSVVHWATVCGEHEALEMVLRAGASISTPDMHGGYPLHYAAQMCGPGADLRGDPRAGLAVLRALLAFGANVDERDKDGRQPILWAASADAQSRDPGARFRSSGSAEAILALVKAGAKVEAADKDGLTALHCAASRGHTDCLETLVALCGCHVDTIDVNGCTALFYAATLGHADSTQLLLNLGAEPNRQDRKGRTPAHCGAAKGQLETLRLLLAGGANLWLRNVKGDLPLHEAVASGRRELVRWLLNQRPDAVNVANNDGKCSIHVASINNNVEMIKILLDAGSLVNPVLRNNKGTMMTPLDTALMRGHRSTAKFLQLHGGVPRTKLTDSSAALRGTMPREMMGTDHCFDDDSFIRVNAPVASIISASPRFLDQPLTTGRLGPDDVAIRHVERIDVPEKECQLHHRDRDSSEEESRYRRRRRRRRSERKRRESLDNDDESNEEASQDSGSRRQRKTSKSKSHSVGNRQSRSKKHERKQDDCSEDDSASSTGESSPRKPTTKIKATDKKNVSQNEEPSKSNEVQAVLKEPTAVGDSIETEVKKAEHEEMITEQPVIQVAPEILEPTPVYSENCNRDSSLDENNEPVTVQVEAQVHYSQSEEPVEITREPEQIEITEPLIVTEMPIVTVTETTPQDSLIVTTSDVVEGPENISLAAKINDEMTWEPPIPEIVQSTPTHFQSQLIEEEAPSYTKDVAFYKLDESGVPDRRRSLTQPDGSEIPDHLDEMPLIAPSHRRQSLVSTSDVITVKRSRRRSDVGVEKPAPRSRRGSLFLKTESEEQEDRIFRPGDVDTVIKNVGVGDLENRSVSIGDDSGGSTRYEDSSALPDSGIEPSPRHDRRNKSNASPSVSPSHRLVPRLCRKNRGEHPATPVSVTRAVQSTIRKYHLERKIFYQLLELKRLQIRAGRANEQVLVKRLVDDYQRAGHVAGLNQYSGIYSFRQFERFLYDQLHTLQSGSQLVIPQLKPTDDIETLSEILKKTRAELQDGVPENPALCTHSTHRCPHAAHAYTGIPCAAYITKLNHHTMPKESKVGFLPRIDPGFTENKMCNRRTDKPDRPVTLELIHGREKQVISLPTENLDRRKRYYVTFTIKGSEGATSTQTENTSAENAINHPHAKTV